MANGNNVTITGNTTREPELQFSASGNPVCRFGVAVNRRWQNRQTQEWEEAVSFFDVSCFGDLAENVAENVGKGTRVIVAGRLDQRSWETETGDKRSKVEIVADDVATSHRWATSSSSSSDNAPSRSSRPVPSQTAGNPDEEPF